MNGKSLFEIIRLITRVPNSVHAFYVTVNAGIGGPHPITASALYQGCLYLCVPILDRVNRVELTQTL